jgi:hypothetical protein
LDVFTTKMKGDLNEIRLDTMTQCNLFIGQLQMYAALFGQLEIYSGYR